MEAPGSHLVNPGRPAAAGRMGAWFRRSWFLFIAWPWLAIAQESNAPVVERPTPTHRPEAVSPRAARFKPSRSSVGEIVALGHDVVVKEGETVRTVVVLGGSASVDGRISDDLVVLMGNVRLGPNAEVRHDLVVVGGKLESEPGAKTGHTRLILSGEEPGGRMFWTGWPAQWLSKGLFYGRVLPHQFGWSWAIAGVAFLLYFALAVLFPRQVQMAVTVLEERPGNALLAGLLACVLLGPFLLLLAITVVGLPIIPFVLVAFVGALLFGKVAVYRYAGQQIGHQFGVPALQSPLLALLAGVALFCLLYAIPALGLLAWAAVVPLGLGAVLVGVFKRSRTASTVNVEPPLRPEAASTSGPAAIGSAGPSDYLLPRAGFWLRFLASVLDLLLIGIVVTAVFHRPRWFLLLWVVYHLLFWWWRATTIGGIVFGLKIVRLDGGPMTVAVALVRLLGSFFSAAVLGLGFFSAGWSQENQSWHDKMAGTVIVKAPRGASLV